MFLFGGIVWVCVTLFDLRVIIEAPHSPGRVWRGPIAIDFPLANIATTRIASLSTSSIVFSVLVVAFTACAAVIDVRTRKIPNSLTVPFCLAGVAFNVIVTWPSWAGLQASLLGFAAGFAIMFVLWLIGGGGAGDLKLMAALGAWLGPKPIVAVFLLSSLVVLVISAVKLLARVARQLAAPPGERRPHQRIGVTYALPVACGTWLVLAWMLINKDMP
jgi:prepilin peptidase CpaA